MIVIVDTREQSPYAFQRFAGVTVERAALPTGDYSLPGFEDRIAIERKEIDDLIGCLKEGKNGGRERFERELVRGSHYEYFAVMVEASLDDVSKGRYRSEMKSKAVLASISAFSIRYRIPFIWAGNRAGAEYMTYSLLSKYSEEIQKRFKTLTKAQSAA